MEDSKNRLTNLDDDSGLELSLGLSLGSKKQADASEAVPSEDGKPPNQAFWLDAAKRRPPDNPQLNAVLQQQQTTVNQGLQLDVNVAERLKQILQEKGGFHFGDDVSTQQIAAAWGQFTKQASKQGSLDLAKNNKFATSGEQDDDLALDPLEQQKRFNLHQEARKKRKMMIDEQKQQKKNDDKPVQEGPENVPPLHRTTSLGNFPPSKDGEQQPVQQGKTTDDGKNLLGSWQLGTTKDMPSAENINPELSTMRPGMIAGQIGGTGSSPDLPWVSAKGPNGRTVTGVMYKLYQGQFKVVCACHGLHMSPTEFVRHAGQDAVSSDGVKGHAGTESMSMLSQPVTPA